MIEMQGSDVVHLDVGHPIWERFFTVAPLVLIGTEEPDGGHDLAPKHMAMPMSWQNYFGFVCAPNHRTYQNIRREGAFTVSYPRPTQILLTSLAAGPRWEDNAKHDLKALPTFPAREVKGRLVVDAYAFLECRVDRMVEGLGVNSLIIGKVVAAAVDAAALRASDSDDQALLHNSPLLVYLYPGRTATVTETVAFPFPRGFKR